MTELIETVNERLKLIETTTANYKAKFESENKPNKLYEYNAEILDKIRNGDLTDELILSILTPYKIKQELLEYELLHYKQQKIVFEGVMKWDTANLIKKEFDKFRSLANCLEDSWTINFHDTLNFTVQKNRIVLSNTIRTQDYENTKLSEHLDALIDFVDRNFDVKSVKYVIHEDNKYHMIWVLVSIGYWTS